MTTSDNDRRIDNIEFAVKDIARSRAFYAKAIGWSFKDYGPGIVRRKSLEIQIGVS